MTYALRDFGSYTVGGHIVEVTQGEPTPINFTRSAQYLYDPRGHFAVEQAYVQYFVPEPRRPDPPVVLVHGGGLTGACWETTPDGRPGWVQLLVQKGYEVHVLDNAERGRAGFAPGLWAGDPILRSVEESWELYRIGAPEGFKARTPFPGQQFPAAALDALCRITVPRWLTTTPILVAGLRAVLERLGRSLVICHSQGGEIAFDVQEQNPDLFAGIIALEPSGFPRDPSTLRETPLVIAMGDYLDVADHWRERRNGWRDLAARLGDLGAPTRLLDTQAILGPGNSHMLMMDMNSAQVLDACLSLIDG